MAADHERADQPAAAFDLEGLLADIDNAISVLHQKLGTGVRVASHLLGAE